MIRKVDRPRPSFRPILFLMVFGAAIRMMTTDIAVLPIDTVFAAGTYVVWMGIALTSPPLALLAWWLVHRRDGVWRYRGMWFRLASDVGVFTVIFAYHLTTVLTNPLTELRLMSRYVVGAALLYVIGLVVADLVALMHTERIARRG